MTSDPRYNDLVNMRAKYGSMGPPGGPGGPPVGGPPGGPVPGSYPPTGPDGARPPSLLNTSQAQQFRAQNFAYRCIARFVGTDPKPL